MFKEKIKEPEVIMSICAIFLSLLAVGVALFEANIARSQQKSSVWPYLEVLGSNINGTSWRVSNKGIGPAKIKDVKVTVNGAPIRSWKQWLVSLDSDFAWPFTQSTLNGRVVSPGESIGFIKLNPKAIEKLKELIKGGVQIKYQICYCSVYQDCWVTQSIDSQPVNSCKKSETSFQH
ncbi:hypothetical protein [Aliikangiella coralliicola]|uniref:Uncharacterized protein n=1 Tax=Aliikangiella coralliicola TaxID=2592383 RepID=A0A545UFC7_9GAMM|nr:hypothetical protein [Aliikangiella coralliicola]TQV88155.1 hypothetical protein FLL46_06400 [Aliikangiella coralliicola]